MFDKYRCTVRGCRYSSNTPALATTHIVRHDPYRPSRGGPGARAVTTRCGSIHQYRPLSKGLTILKLRPFQKEAADFLLGALSGDGKATFKSPIAVGRTLIVIDAAKRFPGNVAIVSRHRLIREQYRAMAEKSGAKNISVADLRVDPAAFAALILDSETDGLDAGQTPVVTLGHL